MMGEYYKLDENHIPVPCDLYEWGKMFEDGDGRRVGYVEEGDISVSTVFLGMNHNWGDGPPLLFETMIFGGEHDQDQWRHATWDEAVAGHKEACALAGIPANTGTPSSEQ